MRLFQLYWLFILWLNVDKSLQQNAQQCSIIRVDDNVQVNGNLEEATNGTVVRFSCKSNTDILKGSAEIYCEENGEWSGPAPKCKGITCDRPVIEHGRVIGDNLDYKEHEVLQFECNHRYTRTEFRPSTCIKVGSRAEFSPTPVCEPDRCRLERAPGTWFENEQRNLFSPGETVTVNCGEKYWIVNQQTTSTVTTCQDNGQWTVTPVCKEVICNRWDQLVHRWFVTWGQIKFGDTVNYQCKRGYRKTDGEATCTRNGWHPNPLCEALQCVTIRVDDDVQVNGNLEEATNGTVVRFSCKSNTEFLKGSAEIYCDENGEWSDPPPKCIGITCDRPVIEHGHVIGDNLDYKEHEVLQFECNHRYTRIEFRPSTCIKVGSRAEFSPTPVCESVRCRLERSPGTWFENEYRNLISPGETVTVNCGEKYWIVNQQTTSTVATCQDNGQWTVTPACKEVICNRWDQLVTYWSVTWAQTKLGDTVNYQCKRGYRKTDDSMPATCTRNGWHPNPLCEGVE